MEVQLLGGQNVFELRRAEIETVVIDIALDDGIDQHGDIHVFIHVFPNAGGTDRLVIGREREEGQLSLDDIGNGRRAGFLLLVAAKDHVVVPGGGAWSGAAVGGGVADDVAAGHQIQLPAREQRGQGL